MDRNLIRDRRRDLGMTMKELSEKVGVSEGTVSRWESGNISSMRASHALSLAQVLSIPLSVFGVDQIGQKIAEKGRIENIMALAFGDLEKEDLIPGAFDPTNPKDAALYDIFRDIAEKYDLSDLENSLLEYYRSATPEAQKSAFMVLQANQKEESI